MWDVRYRPLRFSEVLGQDSAACILKSRLIKGTALDTSYIFSGGHGQGKTTLARILARAMLCSDLQPDGEPCNVCVNCQEVLADTSQAFTEKDAASNGTIDQVRKIVNDLPFIVQGAEKRVYLFDEMHRMSPASQDVLLKPLEEKSLVGIFCTTEAGKIRGTIRSRCEEYKIRTITRQDILLRMKWILAQEQVDGDDEALLMVIDYSHGHVRDVINKLEMIAQLGPITVDSAREYLNLSVVSMYYEILLSLGTPATSVRLTETACDQVGPEAVYEGLAEAAMTSYRMANGMYVDYTYVDKALATKVHNLYGDNLLQLTEHFVGVQKPSQLRLIYDVLACASGSAPSKTAPTKVQVLVSAPVMESPPDAPQAQPEGSIPAQPAPSKPPSAPPPASQPSKIGNLGSDDPCARTSLDTKAIRTDMPRGVRESAKHFDGKPKGKSELLTAEEWRQSMQQRIDILFRIQGDNG